MFVFLFTGYVCFPSCWVVVWSCWKRLKTESSSAHIKSKGNAKTDSNGSNLSCIVCENLKGGGFTQRVVKNSPQNLMTEQKVSKVRNGQRNDWFCGCGTKRQICRDLRDAQSGSVLTPPPPTPTLLLATVQTRHLRELRWHRPWEQYPSQLRHTDTFKCHPWKHQRCLLLLKRSPELLGFCSGVEWTQRGPLWPNTAAPCQLHTYTQTDPQYKAG